MTRAQALQNDLHDLVMLAVAIERHAHGSDMARDMLVRLHETIRSTHREILIADANAVLRAASNVGGLS